MWILALHDKLYWLIKGQTYKLGRNTKSIDEEGYIEVTGDTSVSRPHASIKVCSASPDSALHPSVRSDLVITDLNSRFGTNVEGTFLHPGSSYTLPQPSNGMASIRLGRRTKVRLLWHSFVITYSTGQTGDSHNTLWQHALDILEPLDVKLMPYIVKSTDLFVKTGKTTTSLYYALTKQIPIANNQYFDALQASAVEISKNGTLDSVIIPNFLPFLPEPRWAPNQDRASCFANLRFHVPSREFAKAIEPILEAAGGICVNAESANKIDVIHIYSSISSGAKPRNIRFAVDNSVFKALEECRPLLESEIQSTTRKLTPKPLVQAKRTKLGILEIMTTKNSQSAASPVWSTTEAGSTSTANITSPRFPPNSKRTISAVIEPAEYGTSAASKKTKASEAATKQGDTKIKQSVKKRASEIQLLSTDFKKKVTEIDKVYTDPDFVTELEEKEFADDVAFQNYNDLEELAIVEFSMESARTNPRDERLNPSDSRFRGRSNYKAFRRSGEAGVHYRSTRVDYELDAASDNQNLDDEDMLADDDKEIHHAVTGADKVLSTEVVSTVKGNTRAGMEARLFVDSEEDERGVDISDKNDSHDYDAANFGKQKPNKTHISKDPVDEFDFSFS